jgi:hypothetical protein
MGASVALISQTRITTVARHGTPAFEWQAGRTAGHVEGCLRGLGRSGAANPAFQRNSMSSAQYYCAHSSPAQLRQDALPQPLLDRAVPTLRSGVRISPFSHAMCGDGQPSRVITPPSKPEAPAKELLSRRFFSALACASGVGDKSIYRLPVAEFARIQVEVARLRQQRGNQVPVTELARVQTIRHQPSIRLNSCEFSDWQVISPPLP